VQSSNLKSVGYDPYTLRLEIEFHNGGVYVYNGVPAHVHAERMNAPSLGRYFAQNIKNQYAFSKLA
jgi:hypothetical protein